MKPNNPVTEKFCAALAANFKNAREENGISKSELSQRTGLSRQSILYTEELMRVPSVSTLHSISLGLDLPLWKLVKQAEDTVYLKIPDSK